MEGSSLISDDNTEEQNRRMVSHTLALTTLKQHLLKQSDKRYEINELAHGRIQIEFTKSILDSMPIMASEGVPEHLQARYRVSLATIQLRVNALLVSLVHDLDTTEQEHRQAVDRMYARAIKALARELKEHRAHSNALQSLHGDRAAPPLISPVDRQDSIALDAPAVKRSKRLGKRRAPASNC